MTNRGIAFTLLVIPASIAAFVIVGGLFQFITGFVAIIVAPVAAWLYAKGAGAPVARAAWAPFILITVAAIILGLFSGIAAATYSTYLSVGGDGGLFSSAYLSTLGRQFTRMSEDALIPVLFGLGLGAVSIVSVLRGPQRKAPAGAVAPSAAPEPTVQAPTVQAPTVQAPAAQAPTSTVNKPSEGIMLNGKPLDPKKKN